MHRLLARELAKKDSSLVGFWPLQGNLLDYSGQGYHGTMAKGTQLSMSAQDSRPTRSQGVKAYSFGVYSTDNFIDAGLGANANFGKINQFSVSCWFCRLTPITAPSGTKGSLVSRVSNSGSSWTGYDLYVTYQSNPQITFGLYNSNVLSMSITCSLESANSMITGKWYHVVATYNGNQAITGLKIYINGRLLQVASIASSFSGDITASSGRIEIGHGQAELSALGQHLISCVKIYKRLLGEKEVAKAYISERAFLMPRKSGNISVRKFPSNNLTLFINGSVDGSTPKSNSLPLYISGYDTSTSGLPLYIAGILTYGSGLPLHIGGISSYTHGLNFFLSCPTKLASPKVLPLTIVGNTPGASGFYRQLPLYIGGTGLGHNMNLFLAGSLTDQRNASMNMYIGGVARNITKATPLFVCNTSSGVNNNMPLSITGGVGTVPGISGTPVNRSFNLFIKRWPTNILPLFLCCAAPIHNNVQFHINGAGVANSGVPLVMPKVVGSTTKSTPLFVSGY